MNNNILETLQKGKEFAESDTATMLSGGKKLREYFRTDIANILNKRSQRETLCFWMVLEEITKYNLDMWIDFQKKAPTFFSDLLKAMITYEVVITTRDLNINDFDFDVIYGKIYQVSEKNYDSYKSTGYFSKTELLNLKE